MLERLADREFPPAVRRFSERDAVVVARRPTFETYAREAFSDLGRFTSSDARVAGAVLEALEAVAAVADEARASERLHVLAALASEIGEPALEDARTARDRALLEALMDRITERTGAG